MLLWWTEHEIYGLIFNPWANRALQMNQNLNVQKTNYIQSNDPACTACSCWHLFLPAAVTACTQLWCPVVTAGFSWGACWMVEQDLKPNTFLVSTFTWLTSSASCGSLTQTALSQTETVLNWISHSWTKGVFRPGSFGVIREHLNPKIGLSEQMSTRRSHSDTG